MKHKRQMIVPMVFLLLTVTLLISIYTAVLQRSYGRFAEDAAVARDTRCADAIHQVVFSDFTKNDFQSITTRADMETPRYQQLQRELSELRRLNSTRYLYTAKRGEDGRLIYLIDGLDLNAEDFAYPGTYIEKEMIPYINAALNGQTIYSKGDRRHHLGPHFHRPLPRGVRRRLRADHRGAVHGDGHGGHLCLSGEEQPEYV